MKMSHIALIAAVMFAPAAAYAESPDYNYVGISYLDFDGSDGFSVDGSYAFRENWHVVTSGARVENGGSVNGAMLGAGWNYPVTATTDFVARGGFVRFTGETEVFLEGGVRSMVQEALELNAFLVFTGFDGETSLDSAFRTADPGIRLGGVYNFTYTSGVTFGIDDDSSWTIGYRFSF